MIETLLSVGSGGLLGGVLSLGKLYHAYRDKKLRFQHELDLARETRANLQLEIEMSRLQGEQELVLESTKAENANYLAAIQAEASIANTSTWVADLRGSTRPILTYGLVLITAAIAATDPTNEWIGELVFLASTAVTFWFGDRPRSTK